MLNIKLSSFNKYKQTHVSERKKTSLKSSNPYRPKSTQLTPKIMTESVRKLSQKNQGNVNNVNNHNQIGVPYDCIFTQDNLSSRNMNQTKRKFTNNLTNNNKNVSYLLGLSSYPTKIKSIKSKSCQNSQEKIVQDKSKSKINKLLKIQQSETKNRPKLNSTTTTNMLKKNKKPLIGFNIVEDEKKQPQTVTTIQYIGTQPLSQQRYNKSKNFFNERNKTQKFLNEYSNIINNKSKSKSKSKNLKQNQLNIEQNHRRWDQKSVPLSYQEVLSKYSHYLTNYEKKQITEYKHIFYIGHNCSTKSNQINLKHTIQANQSMIVTPKYEQFQHQQIQQSVEYLHEQTNQKRTQQKPSVLQLQQFDNQQKQYQYHINDQVAYRYQIIQKMGKGSYGQVVKVYDHKRNQFSALKIIVNKQKFNQQAFTQINILTHIREKDTENQSNMVKIKDFIIFRQHVCIIFQLLSQNLYQLIVRNNYNGLNEQLIRRFAIQLLTGLKFLKQNNIIHCDLKPENILLREYNKSGLKIIDLGSSCFKNQTKYTYIQSRYYRAPEITLGLRYSHEIDMWSMGCILGELYTGIPLFPGENQREQMKYFVKTLGPPPFQLTQLGQRSHLFFNEKNQPLSVIETAKSIDHFEKSLKERINNKTFFDFLQGFLRWDPKKRFTPIKALNHEWIKMGLPPQIKKIIPSQNQQQKISKRKESVSLFKKNKSKSIQKQPSKMLKKQQSGSKIRIKKNSQQQLSRKSKDLKYFKD